MYVKFEHSILESTRLTPYEKLVWCAIASFNGFVRLDPTELQISQRCAVSPREVRRCVGSLQSKGLIEKRGRQYRLLDPDQWAVNLANQVSQEDQQSSDPAYQSPTIEDTLHIKSIVQPPAEPATVVGPEKDMAQRVFDYYCAAFAKNGAYLYTPKRKAMLKNRAKDAMALVRDTNQDLMPSDHEVAVHGEKIMIDCIQKLVRSRFHSGENNNGTKYQDLEIIFRSSEKFEWWVKR